MLFSGLATASEPMTSIPSTASSPRIESTGAVAGTKRMSSLPSRREAISPVLSTTWSVLLSGLLKIMNRAGAAMSAIITIGTTIVVMMKLLRFTRSAYSLSMMSDNAFAILFSVWLVRYLFAWYPARWP